MEKYARVLVIIFFLCLINLGFNLYILSIVTKPVTVTTQVVPSPTTRPPTGEAGKSPQAIATTPATIQSDLTVIKAEIRALREALDVTGLIETTPTP
jgi:hypothetical protein